MNFESSTACGSSGGPLINSMGEIVAVNTGSFDDETEFEEIDE